MTHFATDAVGRGLHDMGVRANGMFPVAPAGLHGIPGEPYGPALIAPYGRAVFVDVPTAPGPAAREPGGVPPAHRGLRPALLLTSGDGIEQLLDR